MTEQARQDKRLRLAIEVLQKGKSGEPVEKVFAWVRKKHQFRS